MQAANIIYRVLFYALLLLFGGIAFWFVHNSATDATWTFRQLYPYDVWRASDNYSCSGPEEGTLHPLLGLAARDAGSLASQLAYLSPAGELTTCSSAAHAEEPSPDKRFRYASLTKLLTAQAVMEAMYTAVLPLDTPLSVFIRQVAEAKDRRWQAITVRQLLSHNAGFDRLQSTDPMTAHAVKPWCPNDLNELKSTSLDLSPGAGYTYSNLTYCLLGVVLEKLSGQEYRAAMEQHFNLSAYGIRFVDGPYLPDEVTYDFRHTGFYGEDYYHYLDFQALSSSAGLSGSAKGLVRLLGGLRQRDRLMVLPDRLPTGCDIVKKRNCYGLALFPYRQDDNAPLLWVQQGYLFGVSSLIVLDEQGGVLVWLGNGKPAKGSGPDVMLEYVSDYWDDLSAIQCRVTGC